MVFPRRIESEAELVAEGPRSHLKMEECLSGTGQIAYLRPVGQWDRTGLMS